MQSPLYWFLAQFHRSLLLSFFPHPSPTHPSPFPFDRNPSPLNTPLPPGPISVSSFTNSIHPQLKSSLSFSDPFQSNLHLRHWIHPQCLVRPAHTLTYIYSRELNAVPTLCSCFQVRKASGPGYLTKHPLRMCWPAPTCLHRDIYHWSCGVDIYWFTVFTIARVNAIVKVFRRLVLKQLKAATVAEFACRANQCVYHVVAVTVPFTLKWAPHRKIHDELIKCFMFQSVCN